MTGFFFKFDKNCVKIKLEDLINVRTVKLAKQQLLSGRSSKIDKFGEKLK